MRSKKVEPGVPRPGLDLRLTTNLDGWTNHAPGFHGTAKCDIGRCGHRQRCGACGALWTCVWSRGGSHFLYTLVRGLFWGGRALSEALIF
eukprot:scaffold84841_cov78-Phaeocystis_antarctica.AAC.1